MKLILSTLALLCIQLALSEDIRLLDLEPTDAQQYIDKQDTTLKYAPKVDSNVPAVRYLGNEPHNVLEDIYLANQYHGQDGLGGYLYGYSVPDIAKTERKKAGGDLRGAYNYIAGNGQEIKVEYWDDGTGFHQIDNVPKVLPQQIEDTPELKAAKEEHLRIWREQAERNSKPIADPFDTHGYAPLSAEGQQVAKQQLLQYQQNQQTQQTQKLQEYQSHAQYQTADALKYKTQPQVPQYQQPQYQQPQIPQNQPINQYQQPKAQQYQPTQLQPQVQQPQAQQLVNQYQQKKQQYPNPGQSVVYQGDQSSQFQAQQTQTVNQYQARPQQNQFQAQTQQNQFQAQTLQNQYKAQPQHNQYQAQPQQNQGQQQSNDNDDGEYRESDEGEYKETDEGQYVPQEGEEQGPPRGFFYNFDYPVGIIVQKDGGSIQKREGDVKDVYATNKALFEQQLQGQPGARPARSSTGYLYVH